MGAVDAGQIELRFHHRQTMAIRSDHRHTGALQQQQRAVQREARLFHRRSRKSSYAIIEASMLDRNLRQHIGHLRQLRKALARHPSDPRTGTSAHQAGPLVFLQLDLEIRIWQQSNIIQQPLRRDRSGTLFFTRAGQEERMPNSRSVAVKLIRSPSASTSTFDRIGMVVFFSTTPWDRFNSRTRSVLLTVNSIVPPCVKTTSP